MEKNPDQQLALAGEHEREEAEEWSRVMRHEKKAEFDHFHLVGKISRFEDESDPRWFSASNSIFDSI